MHRMEAKIICSLTIKCSVVLLLFKSFHHIRYLHLSYEARMLYHHEVLHWAHSCHFQPSHQYIRDEHICCVSIEHERTINTCRTENEHTLNGRRMHAKWKVNEIRSYVDVYSCWVQKEIKKEGTDWANQDEHNHKSLCISCVTWVKVG